MSDPIQFAKRYHRGQKRKNGAPYITHPMGVMKRVKELGLSKESECAAVLHDIYEQCRVPERKIIEEFGYKIHFMVYALSKDPKEYFPRSALGYYKRLEVYLSKLEEAAKKEPELVLLKMCDQLDNLESINAFSREKYFRILNVIQQKYFPLYKKLKMVMPQELDGKFNRLFYELNEKINFLNPIGNDFRYRDRSNDY